MTSSTVSVNMRRARFGRPFALFGLVMALLVGAPLHAGAVFTNPDPADDYTTPFLYEAFIDPPAEYGVPAFTTAPNGDVWAFHRDGLEEYDNLMAVYEPGSSAISTTMPMPGRWLSSMAFGSDGLLYGTDLTSTGETQSVVAFDPQDMSEVETFGLPDGETYFLDNPSDILIDASGTVFVLNEGLSTLVRFDATTREPAVFDQPLDADLSGPRGMCFDEQGNILVADTYNARLVTYSPTGEVLGSTDLSTMPVTEPIDVYQDGFGTTYVLGQSPTTSQFIRLDSEGELVGTYPDPGQGAIYYPTHLSVDTWGNLWVNTQPIAGSVGVQRWTFQEGNPDLTPPTTTDDAPAAWQPGPVSVTLSATDTGKSGVDATYYSIDGSAPSVLYTGPIAVSAEGTTTVRYYSVDKAGNAEEAKAVDVRIDRLAPITVSNAVPMYYGEAVIDLTVLEGGSGVQYTQWSLNQGLNWQPGTRVVVPATSYGQYELLWKSCDNVGNIEETKSFLFNVNTTNEDGDARVVYKGAWSHVPNGLARDGYFTTSHNAANAAYFVFKGKNIDIYGLKGPDMGQFEISLNGQNPTTIDCYASTPQRAFLTAWGGLNPTQENVLAIRPLGTKNPAFTGFDIGLDYVDIAGTLEYDTVAPQSTTSADSAWYGPTRPITLTATDNTYVSATRYSVNGGAAQTYSAPLTVSYDGTATIQYWSEDGVGNAEDPAAVDIRCDATPPVTTSDALASYVDSATVTLSASDNLSGVATTQYRVDGGTWKTGTSAHVTGYQQHTVEFRSTDVAGNVETLRSVSLLVKRASEVYGINAPELSFKGYWTTYLEGIRTNYSSTTNSITGFGRCTRIKVFSYRGPTFGWARATVDGRSTLVNLFSPSYSGPEVVYDTGSVPDTDHSFKWAWTGIEGDWGYARIAFHSVEVEGVFGGEVDDTDPPTTTSNIPAGWVKPPFEVVLTQDDYLDHEGETYYGVEQGVPAEPSAPNLYEAPFSVSTDGIHTVSYFSEDTLGNAENLVNETLRLDSIAPTTTSDAVADYTNTATINLTPVDTMSGVAATYVRLDGGAWTAATSITVNKNTTALGAHTVEWYSVDNLGNTEDVRSAQFTLLQRFEDELQQYIEQEGDDWGRRVLAEHSGGLMRYAWGPGALAGTFLGNRFDLISAKDAHSGIARVLIDGTPVGFVDLYSPEPLYQQKVLSLTDLGPGEHVFRVEWTGLKDELALDSQINVDALELVGPIIGDQEPPISVASPTGQWRTTPETVQVWAADNGVVAPRIHYQLSLNGGAFTGDTLYADPFEVSEEGTTEVQFWAVDGVGNVEVAHSAFVRIDRTAPELSDDAPTDWVDSPQVVHIGATDAGCGVNEVRYSTDGSAPDTLYDPEVGIPVSAEGVTTIKYSATDMLGNESEVMSSDIRLDVTDPTSEHDVPASWVDGPVTVHLTASDALSGLARIEYSLDGAPVQTYSGSVLVEGDGQHTLQFAAVDNAGNREATQSVTVYSDETPPATTDDCPSDWVNSPVDVTLTAADTHTAIAETYYRLDSGTATVYTQPIGIDTEGVHTLEYWSVDSVGNVEDPTTVYAKLDFGPPALSDNAPVGWVPNSVDVTLFATDSGSGLASLLYSLDGTDPALAYTQPLNVSAEGTTTIRYMATDMAGNASSEHQALVRIDRSAPVSVLEAPASWSSEAATVSISASDSHSGVASIFYRIDGGDALTYEGPFAVAGDGDHSVEYWSVDAVGNTETARTAHVLVDTTAPSVSDDAPASWVAGPVALALTASDGMSGVDSILYSTDGSEPTSEYTAPLSITTEGATVVRYKAIDAAGNESEVAQAVVRIDGSAPDTEAAAESAWSASPVEVALTASDPLSGVTDTFYRIDGGTLTAYSTPFSVSAEGDHVVEYWSVDAVGNIESPKTTHVRIDLSAPSSADDAPASWAQGPVFVELTSSDSGSGLSHIQYAVDGAPSQTYSAPIVISEDGTHTIAYYGTDNVGHVEDERTVTVRVDSTAPVVTSDAPTAWVHGPVTVSLSANDALSGLGLVEYRLDGGAALPYVAPVVIVNEGTTELSYSSSDVVGNTSPAESAFVRIDNTAPTTAANVAPDYHGSASITLTPGDAHSGVAATTWRLDGGAWTTGTTVNVTGGGAHLLEYYSVDVVGNEEDPNSASFTVTPRYDGSDTSVVYVGSWYQTNHASLYNGSFKQSSSAGASANIAFTGTRIALVTSRNTTYGKARVILDGGAPEIVDLYGTLRFQRTMWDSGTLPDGEHTLRIEYTGTKNASSSGYTIGVDALDVTGELIPADTVDPATSASAPDGWQDTPATVTLSASDNLSGVAATMYRVGTNGEFSIYTAPITIATEGTSTVQYYSVDKSGNSEPVQETEVRVDLTAPESVSDAPEGWHQGPTDVTLSSTDALSGVESVYYSLDGSNPSIAATGPVTVSAQGVTTLKYRAIDAAGNSEPVKSATISIDNDAPVTADDAPAAWVNGPVTVNLTATDAHSGTLETRYSTDGSDPETVVSGGVAIAQEGATTLKYRSVDHAGNTESIRSTTVRIDNSAPHTTSNAASSYTTTATIDLSASDDLSGVSSTQYRINGGNWQSATHIVLGPGFYSIDYRSTDTVGNVEAFHTQAVSVIKRYEQTASELVYSGTWFVTNHPSLSDGSFKQNSSAGGAVSIAFDGTRLNWITSRNTSYGKARVIVDGGAPVEVDLYGSLGFKQNVWSTGDLPDGEHTVRIEYSGTKNASSTGYTIGVDALDVTGTLVSADQVAPVTTISAPSTWQKTAVSVTLSASDNLSGVASTSYRVDGGATQTYSGAFPISTSGVHSVAYWSTDRSGNAETQRTATVLVDLSAPTTSSNALASYTDTATITLTASDPMSGVSQTEYRVDGGTWTPGTSIVVGTGGVHIAEFRSTDVAGNVETIRSATFSVTRRVEQTDARMAWTGVWANTNHANLSGGSFRSASTAGASLEFAFTGTRVSWITSRNTSYGKALVTVDGTHTTEVDLYGAFSFKQTVWTSPVLTNGSHNVKIQVLGTKNASSTGYSVGADAFDITGVTSTRRYEQADALLNYEGTWSTGSSVSLSGGTHTVSATPGSALNVAFNGTGIDWIASKAPSYGQASVTLDAGAPTIVDLYGTTAFQQKVFSASGLTNGAHTLRVEYLGSKNGSSSGYTIGADAFDVAGTLTQAQPPIPPGTRYEQNSSLLAYDGAWATTSNSGLSAGSYACANVSGASVTAAFTGTRIDWITSKSTNYGIAKVTLDANAPVYVDLYGAFAFKQKVWTSGTIADGAHTLKIEFTGTKNPASSGTYVGVDAIDVLGTMTQATSGPPMTRFEDGDATLSWNGTWGTTSNAGLSAGSHRITSTPGSRVTVAFTGTQLDWIGSRNTSYGIANVSVDGGAPQSVDLYGPFAFKQRLWTSGTLTDGAHVVVIEYTGAKNAASSGYTVGVDAFDVAGSLAQAGPQLVRFEQTAEGVALTGAWSTVNHTSLSAGSHSIASGVATATIEFSGTRLDWIGSKSTNYGIARVSLDGGEPVLVDLYGPTAFKQTLWSTGDITAGDHILHIAFTGTKNDASAGTIVGVDAVDVAGELR